MLNADEIANAIASGTQGSADGISIVPQPNISEIRAHGGASIDLRLGRWFLSFRQTSTVLFEISKPKDILKDDTQIRRHFVPFGSKFILHPGRFVLAATLEWIRLPSKISGFVTGKSSWGRRGLVVETAAGVHPGFAGCLTLELANVGEVPLAVEPGMPICQVFLHPMNDGGATASSNFSGKRRPALGSVRSDSVMDRLSSQKGP